MLSLTSLNQLYSTLLCHINIQTEGAAHLQLISKIGLKYVVSVPQLKNSNKRRLDRLRDKDKEIEKIPIYFGSNNKVTCPPTLNLKIDPTLNKSENLAPPLGLIGPTERARIDLANRAFRRYTELQYSLSHTRCCKLRLSYRGKR